MRLSFSLLFLLALASCLPAQPSTDQWYQQSWQDFLAQPALQVTIDPQATNFELLDAAVFHVSNRTRAQHKRATMRYDAAIHQAAELHALAMAKYDFVSHENRHDRASSTLSKRSEQFNARAVGENVASEFLYQYQSGTAYSFQQEGRSVRYFNRNRQEILPLTYLQFAENLVEGWLNSPTHRANLLASDLYRLACAVRFGEQVTHPGRDIPQAHCVQNFGQ